MSAHKHRRKIEICPNCQTILQAENNFCPNCGQENHELNVPIGHLAYEVVESITHFDTKLWNTIKSVFKQPGKITKDFVEGRRASYVHPVRFYIFMSFVFFLLLTKIVDKNMEGTERISINNIPKITNRKISTLLSKNVVKQNGLENISDISFLLSDDTLAFRKKLTILKAYTNNQIDSVLRANKKSLTPKNQQLLKKSLSLIDSNQERTSIIMGDIHFDFNTRQDYDDFRKKVEKLNNKQLDSMLVQMKMEPTWLKRTFAKRISKFNVNDREHQKALIHAFIKTASTTMFLLMPFVAILLLWFFYGKKHYYEHLIFSVHIHTIYFFVFSLVLFVEMLTNAAFTEILWTLALVINITYLIASLKYVYQKTWFVTIFRFLIMSIPYMLLGISLFTLAIIYGFLNS
jgi:hypothetical protein